MPPQLFEGPALNLSDASLGNPHDCSGLRLGEASLLPFSAAGPDPDREFGRRGRVSRPLSLGPGFPSPGQDQRWLALTQASAPPDLPSCCIPEGGNPAAATAGQVDTDFDQAPG